LDGGDNPLVVAYECCTFNNQYVLNYDCSESSFGFFMGFDSTLVGFQASKA
jgi:hypothetical protein